MATDLVQQAIALDKEVDQAILYGSPDHADELLSKLNNMINEFSELEHIEWDSYITDLENVEVIDNL